MGWRGGILALSVAQGCKSEKIFIPFCSVRCVISGSSSLPQAVSVSIVARSNMSENTYLMRSDRLIKMLFQS